MLVSTLALVGLVSAVAARPAAHAAFTSNLAYRSPSLTVPELEIPLAGVQARLGKRWSDTWQGNISFPWGVSSGDPYSDSIILHTLAQKVDLDGVFNNPTDTPICVHWMVSKSNDFNRTSWVQDGYAQTTYDVYYSIKVEATGLQPYTKYYYRFEACDVPSRGISMTGTGKTLPAQDSLVDKIRMAVFSCSNLPFGFFNAYGAAANQSDSLDYWQHVGDYIYEYPNGAYGDGTAINRIPQPQDRECTSLDDYRDRYASYRRDPDLRNLHARLSLQAVWDDHEIADNTYKAGSADSNNTAQGYVNNMSFSQRKANAVRAYFEWMPIRQVDTDDKLRIWRSFKLGKLADMVMADTRQYDRDITDLYYNTDAIRKIANATDRSMTGPVQEKYLLDQLSASQSRGATWRLLMQQVVFAGVNYTVATQGSVDFDFDDWDGYQAQRSRITSYIGDNKINNVVILSGDSHASWVNDVTRNDVGYDSKSGSGAIAVEFAGTAVSSPSSYGKGNSSFYVGVATALVGSNPHLQFAEGQLRGGFFLTITPQNATAEYFGFADQLSRNSNTISIGNFTVDAGANHLRRPINGGQKPQYGFAKNLS